MGDPMDISVLILTLNEEENLPNCLASLGWCDDVVVLDSYSTDRPNSWPLRGELVFFSGVLITMLPSVIMV